MKQYLILLAVVVCLEACTKDNLTDNLSEEAIGFTDGALTRGTPIENADGILSMGVFCSMTDGNFGDWSSDLTNYMNNLNVSRKDAATAFSYAPLKYWPSGTTKKLSFFAYAPHSSTLDVGTLTFTPALRTLTYTVPTDVTKQPDLMVATPKKNLTKTNVRIDFAMKHALTAVGFKIAGQGETVTSIKISGVRTVGTLSMVGDVITWSDLNTPQTTEFTAGTATDAEATDAMTDIMNGDGYLMMIPQDLTADAKLTVTFADADRRDPIKVSLSDKTWTAGKTVVYNLTIPAPSYGSGDILYFDINDGNRLKVGKWGGTEANPERPVNQGNMAFFKFGSVIGFTNNGDDWKADMSQVLFNPSTLTINSSTGDIKNYGNNSTTLPAIPGWTTADWTPYNGASVADKPNYTVSGNMYHTLANIKVGKGDPCQLVGLTAAEVQNKINDGTLATYNSTWRLPTANENVDFIAAPTSWYGNTSSISNNGFTFWGSGTNGIGDRGGGWFPVPGNREQTIGRTTLNTDPNGFLPAAGYRDSSGSTYLVDSFGNYWSSVPRSSNYGTNLFLGNGNLIPNDGNKYAGGFSVRCVRQ